MADIIVLNEITELLNSVNSSLSTSISNVKSVVDTISSNTTTIINNTKVNNTASEGGSLSQKLASIISYTKTNNTASTTGTLSQKISSAIANTAATTTESSSGTLSAKLTYLINRRNRGIKPGSTNFKIFTTSLTSASTVANTTTRQEAYSNYTSGYIAAYNGRYRVYCTATVTVTDMRSVGVTGVLEIYIDNSLVKSKNIVTQDKKGTSASTTVTEDILLGVGQMVTMRLAAVSVGVTGICSSPSYPSSAGTVTATEISVRGTVVELTGNPII